MVLGPEGQALGWQTGLGLTHLGLPGLGMAVFGVAGFGLAGIVLTERPDLHVFRPIDSPLFP